MLYIINLYFLYSDADVDAICPYFKQPANKQYKMSPLNRFLLPSALVAILSTCCITPSNGYDFSFSDVLSGVPTSTEARYKCSFYNLWTSQTHPVDFPDTGAWAEPILVVHTRKFKLWKEGENATAGLEAYAKVRSQASIFCLLC